MSQCGLAGFTLYENQSLTDIIQDINFWIKYSKDMLAICSTATEDIKESVFFIPHEYESFMRESIQICQTNIDDLNIVLDAIDKKAVTIEIVELFQKIGKRAYANYEENKRCFDWRGDAYWHDYSNKEFLQIEDFYKSFADYSATLWDISNAANRLKDYRNPIKEVNLMQYEDNSIHIGNHNKIKRSTIGHNNHNNKETADTTIKAKEKWYSNLIWKIIVPIIISVVVAALCAWLGLK